MRTSLPALLASALVLGVMTAANATEPVPLSAAQLDQMTAGAWTYQIMYQKTQMVEGTVQSWDTRQKALAAGRAVLKNYPTRAGYSVVAVELIP